MATSTVTPATPATVTPATVAATPAPVTMHYRRAHPGGGVLGRCSYGIAGVNGIAVFDVGMFVGAPPAAIVACTLANGVYTPVAMATPAPRGTVATVTSAVVAAGNVAVATATGTPIATPATVATVAAPAAVAALATAATPATPATVLTTVAATTAATPTLRRKGGQ